MSKAMKFLALFTICSALVGCYRMPTDDDACVVPCTNHPDITRSAGHSCMPGFGK